MGYNVVHTYALSLSFACPSGRARARANANAAAMIINQPQRRSGALSCAAGERNNLSRAVWSILVLRPLFSCPATEQFFERDRTRSLPVRSPHSSDSKLVSFPSRDLYLNIRFILSFFSLVSVSLFFYFSVLIHLSLFYLFLNAR